jgi:hypothetical protein
MLRGMKQQPQRKTTKAAPNRSTATSLRYRKIKCAHCSKFFHGPQGLSAHVRTAHRQGPQLDKALKDALTAAPKPAPSQPPLLAPEAPVPASQAEASTGARAHLMAGLADLQKLVATIDEELARVPMLQAQKADVDNQIAAINTAIQAFPA